MITKAEDHLIQQQVALINGFGDAYVCINVELKTTRIKTP